MKKRIIVLLTIMIGFSGASLYVASFSLFFITKNYTTLLSVIPACLFPAIITNNYLFFNKFINDSQKDFIDNVMSLYLVLFLISLTLMIDSAVLLYFNYPNLATILLGPITFCPGIYIYTGNLLEKIE